MNYSPLYFVSNYGEVTHTLLFVSTDTFALVMDSSSDMGNLNHMVETVSLNDAPDSSIEQDASPLDILRFLPPAFNTSPTFPCC